MSFIRRRALPYTDGRAMMMNEILGAIRLVKMYAWEESFKKRIHEVSRFFLFDYGFYPQIYQAGRPQLDLPRNDIARAVFICRFNFPFFCVFV